MSTQLKGAISQLAAQYFDEAPYELQATQPKDAKHKP
jgi:hypothetical protein